MSHSCPDRRVLLALLAVLLLLLLPLAAAPVAGAGEKVISEARQLGVEVPLQPDTPTFEENQAGSRDTLGLVDLGGGRSAIYCFTLLNGSMQAQSVWEGALDFSRARFVAGDVNGDGLPDGILLYAASANRARLMVFTCTGPDPVSQAYSYKRRTVWKARSTYVAARAKLAVGDVNGDGKDDVIALYDKGSGRAELQRFISSGRSFTMSSGWRGRLPWAASQLAAGDVNKDGGDDGIVLVTGATSKLLAFRSTGSAFARATYWSGAYAADAKLTAGDVDSDGDADAVCLRDNGDGRAVLDVFLSNAKAFASPAPWWYSAAGAVTTADTSVAAGDPDADGKAGVVLTTPQGAVSVVAALASTGTEFTGGAWCTGPAPAASEQVACAPGTPLILKKQTVVLDDASMASLDAIKKVDRLRYTFTFVTAGFSQRPDVRKGSVIVLAPCEPLPYGALRKVLSVSDSGGYTTVQTTQAKLDEAVKQGEVGVGDTYATEDMVSVKYATKGVRIVQGSTPREAAQQARRRGGLSFGNKVEFCVELKKEGENASAAATLSGFVDFNQAFDLTSDFGVVRWKWGFIPIFGMKLVRFTSTTEQEIYAEARAEATLKYEKEVKLLESRFNTIVVWFGPVPVTFTPKLTLFVGASGELKVGIVTSLDLTTKYVGGVEWRRGTWTLISDFTRSATFRPPELNGSLNLKAWVKIEGELLVYMLAGPTAAVKPYVALDVDTEADPWWEVSAGLDGSVGVKVAVLNLEKKWEFNLARWSLAKADGARKRQGLVTGDVVSGPAGATTPVSEAVVEVHAGAGAPDGPLVDGPKLTDATGGYSFGGLRPGDYTVTATKEFYPTRGAVSVTIKDGVTLKGQNIDLGTPKLGISGYVATPQEVPIEGATVQLRAGENLAASVLVSATTSAVDGSYGFAPLLPGKYVLVASKSGYFNDDLVMTLQGSPLSERNLWLPSVADQGVSGNVLTGAHGGTGASGATVTLHAGASAPDGAVAKRPDGSSCVTTSTAGGAYSLAGVASGDYTVVAEKGGYVRGVTAVTVSAGEEATGTQVHLGATDGVSAARSLGFDDHIRWPGQGANDAAGTIEFWCKVAPGVSWGALANVSYDTPRGRITTLEVELYTDHRVILSLASQPVADMPPGGWHRCASTTSLGENVWHYVAVSWGWAGMRVYVDGNLEGTYGYSGAPGQSVADPGGGFSLGDAETSYLGDNTAPCWYKGLRVSNVQRYWSNFVPPAMPANEGGTEILDSLVGGTNGWNHGCVWQP